MVPEARWPMIFGQDEQDCQDEQDSPASGDGSISVNPDNPANPVKGSRFWHDALPGGGRVLTWENALVDRLPGRRVSLQVELLPTGDCLYRYDFHDALDPPATNFVIGAQIGTNGVNALAMLGTLAEGAPGGAFTDSGPLAEGAPGRAGWGCLAATVWTMDGAPVTNGVSIADLLCANGQLVLSVPYEGVVYHGSAILLSDNIRFGFLQTAVSAHQCDSSYGDPYCSICGHYQPDDFSLSVCSPLTLKHDDETSICLSHPNSPGSQVIKWGHPLNAPAMIYKSLGVERRPTP